MNTSKRNRHYKKHSSNVSSPSPKGAKEQLILIAVSIFLMLLVALILILPWLNNSGIIPRFTTAVIIGDYRVSNTELNYYYIDTISDTYRSWYDQYGNETSLYMMMIGVDPTQPLSAQTYDKTSGYTWADYFTDAAIEQAVSTRALVNDASLNGYALDQESVDSLHSVINELTSYATQYNGYPDLDSYLKAKYGNGASVDSYLEYRHSIALAASYQDHHGKSLSLTEEEILEYYHAHAAEFCLYDYYTYYIAGSAFWDADQPEHSEEEKAESLQKAELAAKSLLTSQSIEQLNEEIKKLDIYDSEAVSNAHTDITYSQLDSVFQPWICSENRQYADMAVLPAESTTYYPDGTVTTTTNGYYVVFFAGKDSYSTQEYNRLIEEQLRITKLSAWYTALTDAMMIQKKNTSYLDLNIAIADGVKLL